MRRLAPQPGERIDRAAPIRFSFDGEAVSGLAGDTIASALSVAGHRVLSRSFKYHRPRGELCFCGACANSLMTVDGRPGVRACSEPIAEGMAVIHQNAWPSLRHDVLMVNDRLHRLLPPGFYYKTFIRPRRLWPVYEKVLRSASGLGRLPRRQDERRWETDYRRRHCDVLVIGGGLAGLSAAHAAAQDGADVVLCDEDAEPGGRLLGEGGAAQARALATDCRAAGVELLTRAAALGYYDGLVPVWQGSTLHQVRARRVISATGTIEQPLVFADNDLPGVMLTTAVRRAIGVFALAPGRVAVVAATSDAGLDAALALHAAGVRVACVADLRAAPTAASTRLADAGIRVLQGQTVVRACGGPHVQAAVLARVDADGMATGAVEEVACDLLVVGGPEAPAASLLLQSGARARYDEQTGRFTAAELPDGVHAAGAVAGHGGPEAAQLSGALAGAEAAAALRAETNGAASRILADRRRLASLPAAAAAAIPPAVARDTQRKVKAFVDLDEDVTVADIEHAAAEGYDSIELSKRYTTVTMGPSQGRFSQLASIRALARATGRPPAAIGMTTARPPWVTVPMGVLAGRPFEPAKRSPIATDGATVRWAGDWLRAYDYGDPEGEALAVQSAAGLIDVSTLGKLVVGGPDAGELLDRLYPNRMSSLAVGRARYGIMTSETGRITDDGTVCRLAEDTFYVTTTSAGATAIAAQMTWWLAVWELDARVTDVTQALAAVNLAGPRARDILSTLTDADCSAGAFGYLDARPLSVAGVDCLGVRLGFVGEVGFELHLPSVNAPAVWDALLAAGAPHGLRRFGLEPQRLLRLQKLHVIVGQDTDSESTPYTTGMGWAVKLDKEQDFLGKWALQQTAEDEPAAALVGFRCAELPTEGAVVLAGDAPAGQVTSARYSPKLGTTIGLATVPAPQAVEGTTIWISDAGRRIAATVTTTPFYDPEGLVARS